VLSELPRVMNCAVLLGYLHVLVLYVTLYMYIHAHTNKLSTRMHVYIYIYIYMCVCRERESDVVRGKVIIGEKESKKFCKFAVKVAKILKSAIFILNASVQFSMK
jgi:hypothetical protein